MNVSFVRPSPLWRGIRGTDTVARWYSRDRRRCEVAFTRLTTLRGGICETADVWRVVFARPLTLWGGIRETIDVHQEKKCASGRTGCVLTHQALGTLWTHPGSAHTAPNAKRTGNVNLDAARHGTMRPDAARHGICLPDGAWQGIFVLDARCQGIFLLDAWCQGIFLLDAAVSGHFPSGRSHVRAFSFWT